MHIDGVVGTHVSQGGQGLRPTFELVYKSCVGYYYRSWLRCRWEVKIPLRLGNEFGLRLCGNAPPMVFRLASQCYVCVRRLAMNSPCSAMCGESFSCLATQDSCRAHSWFCSASICIDQPRVCQW